METDPDLLAASKPLDQEATPSTQAASGNKEKYLDGDNPGEMLKLLSDLHSSFIARKSDIELLRDLILKHCKKDQAQDYT